MYMKTKLTLLTVSLAAWCLVTGISASPLAQDNNPTPSEAPPPAADKPADPYGAKPAAPPGQSSAGPATATNALGQVGTVTNLPPSTNSSVAGATADATPKPAYPTDSTPAFAAEDAVGAGSAPTGIAATNAVAVTNAVDGTNALAAGVSTNSASSTNASATAAEAAGAADDVVPLIVIEDVPLTDAIRNLARQSNLNFQFDPRVTGAGPDGKATNQPNISIRFENVTAAEALGAVLDNYNLALIKDPKSKIARITVKDPKAEDPLVSRVIQLKYSDPTNIVILLKTALSPRSSVVADTRTSQLIVTTTEKEVDGVTSLVAKLDTPTKQVLIESKILETTRTPSSVKGIDWSGTFENQGFTFGNGKPDFDVSANAVVTGNPNPGPVTYAKQIFVGDGGIIANTAHGFHPATAFLNADGVRAVLSFLNKDSETEVLATPRAVTLDNQTANLSVTRAFPIFINTPGTVNTAGGSQVQYTNLGTILHVTPRIAADKNISMTVVPEVSNIDSVDRQVIQGQLNTANIYAIRRITTHVMIPSGNTLVMGGMVSDSTTKSYTKVPILGDLPGAGALFRKEGKNRNKSDLLIFITPTIVEDGDFHPNATGGEFLKTRVAERAEPKESALDSAKPHDWTKPTY